MDTNTIHAVSKALDTNTIHAVATGAKYLIDTLTTIIIGVFAVISYIAGHAHGIKSVVKQSITESK